MSDDKLCPTCGGSVKAAGRTTMHYEPVLSPAVARLVEACRNLIEIELAGSFKEVSLAKRELKAALNAVEAEMKEGK